VEEFEQVDVVFLLPEVLLEEVVDGRLEHERIVDGNVADVFLPPSRPQRKGLVSPNSIRFDFARRRRRRRTHHSVPARLTAAGDTLVHHVVRDEEVCLELFRRTPGGLESISAFKPESGSCHLPRRTNSMHQPRMAARLYSSSSSGEPLTISTVSTVAMPRFNLPPGVL
jgi:hypothetical protein